MQNNNILECINISNVINKLELKKTSQIGNNIYLTCPFCQNKNEKNGYMKADIIKNLFICNNCQASGTSIDLYANVKYITIKEAYKALLKEEPVLADIPYTYNNPIKDEYYRDLVYRNFLELLDLSDFHKKRLEILGFTAGYIQKNNFKSVEMCEIRKKEICEKLQKMGIKLDGIPRIFSRQRF